MRAALAVLVAYVLACLSVAPSIELFGTLSNGSLDRLARAFSSALLRSYVGALLPVILICLPGFLALRLLLLLSRSGSAVRFAVAGAVNALIAYAVLTFPSVELPELSAVQILVPSGLLAGALYWAVERAIGGRGRVLMRGARQA